MKHLKTYKLFEDILSGFRMGDVEDILYDLEDDGFIISTSKPSMRQDMWQITIKKGSDTTKTFVLSDVQDTLSRLHDYFKLMDKNLSVSVASPITGMQILRFHDSMKEYRNSVIRKDTSISLIFLSFSK